MRRWLAGIMLGLACAAGVSAYAVSSGGFPSRPWLQALGVGAAAPSSGALVAAGSLVSTGNGGAPSTAQSAVVLRGSNQGEIMQVDSAGATDDKIFDTYLDPTGALHFRTLNDVDSSGYDWLVVSRSGISVTSVNFPAGAPFEVQGRPLTEASFGGNPTCSVSSGAINAASCVRNAAGDYTLTFTTPYPTEPVCTASAVYETPGNIPIVADISATTTASVRIWMLQANTTGTGFDGTAYVICH